VEALPSGRTADVLGRQLIRSGTSVGANYRSAQRAKSTADFINKLKIVEEEADESGYWLELLADADVVPARLLAPLTKEADELTAIVVAAIKSARTRR
jgi:four helix bundle protein